MDDTVRLCHHKLSQQISALEALTQLLVDELEALASRRGDSLKDIAREKLSHITKLQQLDKELAQVDVELFKNEELTPLVDQVKSLLNDCKRKNEVNAKAAHHANVSTRELKEILIGVPASVTYGEDGSVKSSDNKLVKNLKA
ncbi:MULTISPECIES: flagella synthesis protein FlgN [unclassified Pseudoalteromonas]|uniref:flagella synthesis protein FlgN n=1 Tax=unclassified Pseudoalteromonas TaxID=194690 RepID=UPI003014D001